MLTTEDGRPMSQIDSVIQLRAGARVQLGETELVAPSDNVLCSVNLGGLNTAYHKCIALVRTHSEVEADDELTKTQLFRDVAFFLFLGVGLLLVLTVLYYRTNWKPR